jgi:hypothetical protein
MEDIEPVYRESIASGAIPVKISRCFGSEKGLQDTWSIWQSLVA